MSETIEKVPNKKSSGFQRMEGPEDRDSLPQWGLTARDSLPHRGLTAKDLLPQRGLKALSQL